MYIKMYSNNDTSWSNLVDDDYLGDDKDGFLHREFEKIRNKWCINCRNYRDASTNPACTRCHVTRNSKNFAAQLSNLIPSEYGEEKKVTDTLRVKGDVSMFYEKQGLNVTTKITPSDGIGDLDNLIFSIRDWINDTNTEMDEVPCQIRIVIEGNKVQVEETEEE